MSETSAKSNSRSTESQSFGHVAVCSKGLSRNSFLRICNYFVVVVDYLEDVFRIMVIKRLVVEIKLNV